MISGWETVFGVYDEYFPQYHFDRFPDNVGSGIEYVPDFSVYFNSKYGVIAKILPQPKSYSPEKIATKLLEMCSGVEDSYAIEGSDGTVQEPEMTDIVAFVPNDYSSQFGDLLAKRFDDGYSLEPNLILIRYGMDDQRANYVFQRETRLDQEFREDHLPDEQSLSNTIGPDGGYQAYQLGTKEFLRAKTHKPIYNVEPPESYLASYLWMKVFPTELSDRDFQAWREGNIVSNEEITVRPPSLQQTLNTQRIEDGDVAIEWIENCLQFLSTARHADEANGRYDIKYTGLVKDIDISGEDSSSAKHERRRELAITLIRRYCKYGGMIENDNQTSLVQFE
ncbi:hypothetical protein [Haloarcula rubra]|uniref:hypothetical protein n=1 Tax=Haloarcula rubra TaxID=2487747 RepID=UPI001C73494F|nr:hypothetical protein [Halomicroarcula rubra]